MRFAKWVFLLAGVSGILVAVPPYFLEGWSAQFDPPPINHPEYYYGFLGVVLAFQFLYLLIASNPTRFRPMMLVGVVGKGSFVVTVVALYVQQRVSPWWLGFAAFDATCLVLFVVAYFWVAKDAARGPQ
jgi:hypothetical protein